MKFVSTLMWDLINFEDVYKVGYEEKNDKYYSYFFLRNKEKHDAYEAPESFKMGEKWYFFDAFCHMCMNNVIVRSILELEESRVFDINQREHEIWQDFILSIMDKVDELREFK